MPESFEELGLPKNLLAQLILKHCFYHDAITARAMSRGS